MGGPGGEQAVVRIWERQTFDHDLLERLGIRVLFRGVPADAGGPDYRDAVLVEGERRLISGAVEFHVRSSLWYDHRHHEDPLYNAVVLHVVWQDDRSPTVTLDGNEVPVLAVGPRAPLLVLPSCAQSLSTLDTSALRTRLEACGRMRFAAKRDRFAADLQALDADQVIYAALLESLGHASNRRAFSALADAVPFSWLAGISQREWLPTLLDAAALGPPAPVRPPARLPVGAWRLAQLRPGNHPARRLMGAVDVLHRLSPQPATAVVAAVDAARAPDQLRRTFEVPAVLGSGRVTEMLASTVLPFTACFIPEQAGSHYERLGAPPSTRWTRLMLSRLRQSGHELRVTSALHHQGLHWLYHTHCRFERGAGCPACDSAAWLERSRC